MKLVIVDDSVMILKHAEAILRKSGLGLDILTCQSGDELMRICRQQPVDIVLLDIVMPRKSGMEVLKEIKQDAQLRKIDVLMFSSLSDKETLRDCFELGAADYIAKPIDDLEFNARIKSVVRKKTFEKAGIRYLQEIQAQNEELRAVNTRLQAAQHQLLQQEKLASVGHLAAGVAHEINNPLGFVSSNIETLRKYTGKYRLLSELVMNYIRCVRQEPEDPADRVHFNAVKAYLAKNEFDFINDDLDELYKDTAEGLERVGRIVRGLRNFSRVDQMDEMSLYNLNDGVENTLIISRNEIKYAAEVVQELGDIPDVLASGGQINQVILNLLLNAVSAIRERHGEAMGRITIRTWRERDSVCLTVADDGIGIDPDHLSKVFDPFFTTKPVGEGTGLGLSIGYDIVVNKHHGTLTVESQLGEGTQFMLTLPVSHGAEDALEA